MEKKVLYFLFFIFLCFILFEIGCINEYLRSGFGKILLLYPQNGSKDIPVKDVTLKWDFKGYYEEELKYEVYIGNERNSIPLYKSSISSTSLVLVERLDFSKEYYWYVIAKNSKGAFVKSEVFHFKTRGNSSPKVKIEEPENGRVNVGNTVMLKWKGEDSEGDIIYYDIFVGENKESLKKILEDYRYTTYQLKNLDAHTKYYWKVIAKDAYNAKSETKTYYFITTNNNPNKIENLAPANNSIISSSNSVKLQWECVDPDGDKILYDIYFGNRENLEKIKENLRTNYYEINNLKGHTTYYWQILAKDEYGGERKSEIRKFTTLNNLPEMKSFQINVIRDETIRKDLRSYFYDPDGDELTFRLISGEGELSKDGFFTYILGYDEAGVYGIKIQVSDGYDAVQKTFSIIVENKGIEIVSASQSNKTIFNTFGSLNYQVEYKLFIWDRKKLLNFKQLEEISMNELYKLLIYNKSVLNKFSDLEATDINQYYILIIYYSISYSWIPPFDLYYDDNN